jgi:hypothetical protein
MAHKGATPYQLQAFARHASMRTTMLYYVHLENASLTEGAAAFLDDETDEPAALPRPPGRKPRGKAVAKSVPPEFGSRVLN